MPSPEAPSPNPSMDDDIHLRRLLAPPETPWYQSLVAQIKELINPPKLPPLEVTSKPVDVPNQWGMYSGNETKSGLYSVLIHVSVIALLVILGSIKPVREIIVKEITPI